jgi:hypothetical protein
VRWDQLCNQLRAPLVTAQIFYAKNITGRSPSDQVTVTFTGPSGGNISSAGAVIVEYSGLDQSYPLDSVSAGYSTSGNSTSLLDSGTAAPANGNLLVFGGGTTDSGTASLIINSPFSLVQNHSGSITEQMIVSASMSLPQGNNTLQRAQAGSTASGNWLMQMAVFRDASWTVTGGWNPARPAQVQFADQFPGASADAQINAAIAALSGNGGVVDARGLKSAQTIAANVSIPANTVVNLGPAAVFTCTITAPNTPCWTLAGKGAKLFGTSVGDSIAGLPSPSAATGTVLRMSAGIASTTDMIAIRSSAASGSNTGFEVGNLTIDFANSASSTGRYCLAGYAFSHSWIHDIFCYNPRMNGMEFENTASGWSYDNRLDNITVFAAGNNGFNWTTIPGSGSSDFDRWYCDRCKYVPTSSDGTYHGVNSFALNSGTGASQTIADFFFTNLWTGGTGSSGNAGFYLNQTGTTDPPYIENIYIHGEIEQQSSCGCGYAVKVANANVSSTGYLSVEGIHLDIINDNTGFWFAPNNFTSVGMVDYRLRQLFQGVILPPSSLPGSAVQFPFNGVAFQGPAYGDPSSMQFTPFNDGTFHFMQTYPTVADFLTIDANSANKRLMPSTGNTGNLGIPTQPWATVVSDAFISGGSPAGLSGCSFAANIGGSSAGQFKSGTSACNVVITLPTAPNGWTCTGQDITHPATFTQTATGTASCTISATTASGDVVNWSATAF